MLSKLDLVPLLFDSSVGSGIYNQLFLSFVPSRAVSDDLIHPERNTTLFGVDSVDYAPKSVWGPERNLVGIGSPENHLTDYEKKSSVFGD